MINAVRRFIPELLISAYHFVLAKGAAVLYGFPSQDLIVIGVTGTNGKSTTVHFLGRILEHAGHRVGWTTTVDFKVAGNEWVNDKKMTMLGRFQSQKLLRQMVDAGCRYAIIETSSQGIAQFRHVGINYDVVAFTNLTPEHIEAHGGFENYKRAKGRLFTHAGSSRRKSFDGQLIEKTSVGNIDDPHAGYFLGLPMDKKYGYGIAGSFVGTQDDMGGVVPVVATNLTVDQTGSTFSVPQPLSHLTTQPLSFHLNPLGRFNVYNALAAIACGRALGIDWNVLRDAVGKLEPVPGRLEAIREGQPFSVIVDYAYEPAALSAVYETVALLEAKRIIHVTGSAGGGRDVARRAEIGKLAAEHGAVVVVTNEDPYDDDPSQIVNDVADAAAKAGKQEGVDLFRIIDRQEAIEKAMAIAQPGDLVLITGKGCEPVMAVAGGKKIPWDDRIAARKALHKLGYAH